MRLSAALALFGLLAPDTGAQPTLHPDREIDTALGRAADVALSPDGRFAAAVGADGVSVWDAQTGHLVRRNKLDGSLRRVAFGAQGNVLAIGAEDGRVLLLDLRAAELTEAVRHKKKVTSLAFSPDGALGASGDEEGRILVWDAARGGESGQLREDGRKDDILFLGFTAPTTLVSVAEDLRVVTWDVAAQRPLRRDSLRPDTFGDAAVSEAASLEPGRALLAIASQHRSLGRGGALAGRRGGGPAKPGDLERINAILPYTVETGVARPPIATGDYLAERIAVSPTGCFAFFSSFHLKQPRLHTWDLVGQGADVLRTDLADRAAAVALDPAGRRLAVLLENGWLRTFSVSGATSGDCQTRQAKAATPAAGPRVTLGAEAEPLIPAGAGWRVAVLAFEAGGVEAYMGDAVSEMISGQLSNSRHVQVVERGKIDAIVRELEIQRSGLTTADAVRIGRGLNARKVVFGSVRRFGSDTFVLLARVVDVETQRVEGTRQATCEGCGEKDLPRAVETLSRAIVR